MSFFTLPSSQVLYLDHVVSGTLVQAFAFIPRNIIIFIWDHEVKLAKSLGIWIFAVLC